METQVSLTDDHHQILLLTYNKELDKLEGKLSKKVNKIKKLYEKDINECQNLVSLLKNDENKDNFTDNYEKIQDCYENLIDKQTEEIDMNQDSIVKSFSTISKRLRNYTCDDDELNLLPEDPLRSETYSYGDTTYNVNFYLDQKDAKIFMINDTFISPEECEYFMEYARPRLTTATVAGSSGLGTVSKSRRAQQAGHPIDSNDRRSLPWKLYKKVISVMNYYTGFNILPEGQEGFNIIQYNPGDEYISHCDGACDGSIHKPGGRVATAVIYCKSSEVGGGTSFTKSDVFIKGSPGQVTFFSYYDKDTKRMDRNSLTEHSGCGVHEGEKWIITAWLRLGVDSNFTYTDVDPQGNPIASPDSDLVYYPREHDEF